MRPIGAMSGRSDFLSPQRLVIFDSEGRACPYELAILATTTRSKHGQLKDNRTHHLSRPGAPSHISKTVLPTVNLGPPDGIRT